MNYIIKLTRQVNRTLVCMLEIKFKNDVSFNLFWFN